MKRTGWTDCCLASASLSGLCNKRRRATCERYGQCEDAYPGWGNEKTAKDAFRRCRCVTVQATKEPT